MKALISYQDYIIEQEFQSILNSNESYIGDKLKDLLPKLDKEKCREYFIQLMNKMKSMPKGVRRGLMMTYISLFLGYASIGYLTAPTTKLQLLPEIKQEVVELTKKSSFEEAQQLVKNVEGDYSTDKNDPGCYVGKVFIGSKYGISGDILAEYLDRTPKQADMANLTRKQADDIYKKIYWERYNIEKLNNQAVANIVYDCLVNQGSGGIKSVLKEALSKKGIACNTHPLKDEEVINKMNGLDSEDLFNTIKQVRIDKYKRTKNWNIYGEGWMNRLDTIKYEG